eukprot:15004757-Heterocapsa_arctica.AAC.1
MTPGWPHRSSAYATPHPAISSAFRICCFPFARCRAAAAPLISFFSSGLDSPTSCPCSGFSSCGPCPPPGDPAAPLRASWGEGCR